MYSYGYKFITYKCDLGITIEKLCRLMYFKIQIVLHDKFLGINDIIRVSNLYGISWKNNVVSETIV